MDDRKGVRRNRRDSGTPGVSINRRDVGTQTSEAWRNRRDVGTQTCNVKFTKGNPSKLSVLAIARKNKEHSTYPYYVIRCQKAMYTKSVRDLKRKYPEMTIAYEIRHKSNTMELFNRIKENMGYVDTKFNHLKVDDLEKLKVNIAEFLENQKIESGLHHETRHHFEI